MELFRGRTVQLTQLLFQHARFGATAAEISVIVPDQPVEYFVCRDQFPRSSSLIDQRDGKNVANDGSVPFCAKNAASAEFLDTFSILRREPQHDTIIFGMQCKFGFTATSPDARIAMVSHEVVKARNALHKHPVPGCGCAVFGFLVSFRFPPDHPVPPEAFIVDQSNILEFFSVFGRRAKLLFDKGSAFSRFSIICCILSVF